MCQPAKTVVFGAGELSADVLQTGQSSSFVLGMAS